MAETPPTIYLLYGDHDLAFSEFISRMREKMGDPSTADMNIDSFPSGKLDLGKVEQVCVSFPFLSRRRLVIVEQPSQSLTNNDLKENFYRLLISIPDTTALLIIERVDFTATRGKTPKALNELIHWLEENDISSYIKRFEIPRGSQYIQWIRHRAHKLEGEIQPQAAHLLAELAVGDPHLAHQELSKLLDYVNRDRPIDSPLYAFSMIVRQFRLLLLTKDAQANQQDPQKALDVHPYVAGKIIAQAKNFSQNDLEEIYHLLKGIDIASKTGKDNMEVALEGFVANLTS